MTITLYNTMSRQIEEFSPVDETNVTIYSCGPTVYSRQHLGNLRAAFLVDLYKNVIKYIGGYEVKHVMNITDVGHLTGDNEGDADHGEDRMEKGARQQGITAWDVAEKFTNIYLEDLALLRIDAFDVMPRATDHIAEQIAMVQELEKKGYTYIIDGDGVYMDTSKVTDYGKLIGKKHMEGLEQGARIDDAGKRNVTDFALWKFNITGKKRDMERESPWGIGFPGWHIECSAMSMKYLGDHIDIHTGGMEHIAIHHTNEICQSECSHGHTPWVNYRLHNQRLMMNGKKIAKSDGNVAFMDEVIERGFSGEDVRYFFLQAHYRSFQDFTWEGLEAASKARIGILNKIYDYIKINMGGTYECDWIEEDLVSTRDNCGSTDTKVIKVLEFLASDFDSPNAISEIHKYLKNDNICIYSILRLDKFILKLGINDKVYELCYLEAPSKIYELAEKRWQAKSEKNRSLADELRDEINALGWTMLDGKEGYELQKI